MVLFVFMVSALLFCFAKLTYGSETFEYRYWLMTIIPIFIEAGIVYDWGRANISGSYVKFITITAVLLITGVSFYKDIQMWKEDRGGKQMDGLMEIAQENQRDTIFIYDNFFNGRVFSAFAKDDLEVFAVVNTGGADNGKDWIENEFRMPRWGTYVKYDGDCMTMEAGKQIGIFITPAVGEDYYRLKSKAERVIVNENSPYELLIMNENYMDFQYGIPIAGENHSRDDMSWGYQRNHVVLGEDGNYHSTGEGGRLIEGDFVAADTGTYQAVLHYSPLDNDAHGIEFVVSVTSSDGQSRVYRRKLVSKEEEAAIENIELQQGDNYKVYIEDTGNSQVVLKQIDYFRQ